MPNSEFVPLDHVGRLMTWWWLIATAMVVGGAIGYAIHSQRTPVYEATATFFVTLDSTKISRELPIDRYQYDEDIALAATEGALRANEVLQAVVAASTAQGIAIDTLTLSQKSAIERRHAFWELRFRHPDPHSAQTVVNLWAERGYETMIAWHTAGNVANYVIFNPPILAELPQQPVSQNRNHLMLAGGMIGLVVGIFTVEWVARRKSV
jgi:hypothetical protein